MEKETLPLEDRILELSVKADQLGSIAWIAANSTVSLEKCGASFIDVLYGINDLSKQLGNELADLASEVEMGRA